MIRFLHTSDWHLGRLLYGKSLLEEQAFALARLLEMIDDLKPDALVIAGDIFDRALPPEAAVQLFDWFCSEAVLKRRLPVFVIPGNHDSNERLGFGSQLLRSAGLTIFSKVEDSLKPVRLTSKTGAEALIYGIPFVEPVLISQFLGDESLKTPDAVTRALNQKILAEHPSEIPSILLCHAYVVGGEGSESERDLFIGGSSYVASEAFDGFTYTALGHLHKPQSAGQPNVRYSGSLIAYSKSEVDHKKSISLVTIDKGVASIETLPLAVKRPLIYKEATLAELLAHEPSDAYLIAGLTDAGPVLDATARLRAVFPNVLNVSRAGGFMPTALPSLAEREQISDLDLFAEFFMETTNTEMSADERAALIETLAAVGEPS